MNKLLFIFLALLTGQLFCPVDGFMPENKFTFEDIADAVPVENDLATILPSPDHNAEVGPFRFEGAPSPDASDEEIMAWLTKQNPRHLQQYSERATQREKKKKKLKSILKAPGTPKKMPGGIRFQWVQHPKDKDQEVVFTEVTEIPPIREIEDEMADMHGIVHYHSNGAISLKPWVRNVSSPADFISKWQTPEHQAPRVLTAEELEEAAAVDAEWQVLKNQRIAEKNAEVSIPNRVEIENALMELAENFPAEAIEATRKNVYEKIRTHEQLQRRINELEQNQTQVLQMLEYIDTKK